MKLLVYDPRLFFTGSLSFRGCESKFDWYICSNPEALKYGRISKQLIESWSDFTTWREL